MGVLLERDRSAIRGSEHKSMNVILKSIQTAVNYDIIRPFQTKIHTNYYSNNRYYFLLETMNIGRIAQC